MRWELVFAILFPALAVLVLALRRAWPLTLAGCVYLTWWATGQSAGEFSTQALRYLPLFVIGMVLAERAPHWQPRLRRVPTLVGVALAAAADVLVELPHLQGRHLPAMENSTGWATASAAILVLVVLHAPGLRRWGTHPALAWLASRSFSLYLAHEPILLACSSLLHSDWPRTPLISRRPCGTGAWPGERTRAG